MSKPTPRPWKLEGAILIWSPEGKATVAIASEPRATRYVEFRRPDISSPGYEEACANAAHIVRCVNLMDEAHEALRHARAQVAVFAHATDAMAQSVLQKLDAVLAKLDAEEAC